MATRTKIELNPAMARNLAGLDDLARVLFPDRRSHRRIFVAIWVELKYAHDHFLPSLSHIPEQYGAPPRVLETVRARMKKMGLLKRVSGFDPRHGHKAGWTFSDRFTGALSRLSEAVRSARHSQETATSEQKDRDSVHYV